MSPRQQRQAQQEERQAERRPGSELVVSSAGLDTGAAIARVSRMLEERTGQLMGLLADGPTVERLKLVTLHALADPELAAKLRMADLATVIEAVREAAMNDLMPTGFNGEGYLIAYWNKDKALYDVQFQVGYRGLAKVLSPVAELATGVVYEADSFDYQRGSVEYVRHVPALKNRGERLAVWADATLLRSGNHRVEILTVAEVEERRKVSRNAEKGPWVQWWDAMARKTASLALSGRIPIPSRAERLIALEREVETRYALPEGESEPAPALPAQVDHADRARLILGLGPGSGDGLVPSTEPAGGQPTTSPGRASRVEPAQPPTPSEEPMPVSPETPGSLPASSEPAAPAAQGPTPDGPSDPPGDPPPLGGRPALDQPSCGALGPDGGICHKPAGHPGGHRSEEELWPRS